MVVDGGKELLTEKLAGFQIIMSKKFLQVHIGNFGSGQQLNHLL